jgi:hypothetical protein
VAEHDVTDEAAEECAGDPDGTQPIAWRPGVSARATRPATSPKSTIEKIPKRRAYWSV